ncbi:hypothetical protein Tco_1494283 [Tanacetum coccineum]
MYVDEDMFGVHDLDGDEVVVESEVATKKKDDEVSVVKEVVSAAEETVHAATITEDEITLAQALAELKSVTTKGILLQDPSESITTKTTTTTTTIPSKDKGKGIMVEEPLKMKKKDQINFDEQEALRLQAEFDEEDRLAREKAQQVEEANIAWDDIQAKIDADYQLAERLAEGSEIREESSSKRAGDELKQERTKKQKMDDDKEADDLKSLMKIVHGEEEVEINAIPLATKPPSNVDYKIIKEGNIRYFQIIRANRSLKRYSAFIFDREDLEALWKLVKAKHGSTRPEEGYERVLWCDLKTMFEHHVEDLVWRNLQGNKVLVWKLFDSCGVHYVRFQSLHVFMLVEKRYPLTPATITEMLNKKL